MPTKIAPVFSAMPWHVKQKILQYSDRNQQLLLRKCSKELQNLHDTSLLKLFIKPHVERLHIFLGDKKVSIAYDETFLEYSAHETGCKVSKMKSGNTLDWRGDVAVRKPIGVHYVTCIEGTDHIEKAIADFAKFVKRENCSIGSFELFYDLTNELYENMLCIHGPGQRLDYSFEQFAKNKKLMLDSIHSVLESLPRKLTVKQFHCWFLVNQSETLQILPYLQPGSLERIALKNESAQLEEVLATEQWKNAKGGAVSGPSVPFANFLHMREIIMYNYPLETQEMLILIEKSMQITDYEFYINITLPIGYDRRHLHRLLRNWNKVTFCKKSKWKKIQGTPYTTLVMLDDEGVKILQYESKCIY